MNEDEIVSKYCLRTEETVNSMKGLGEKFDEAFLVHKILRSLPEIFNPKVSTIEEFSDIKNTPIDQLLCILIAYEMRIGKDNPPLENHILKQIRTLILKWMCLRKNL